MKKVDTTKNKKQKTKNVIFIIADTLRAKNVGLYGANPSPTPIIDRLGKQGTVFENVYTSITKTDPSITAIMTGKYPMSSGLISHGRWLIKEQEKALKKNRFLAEILKKNGFYTAAIDCFARWHVRGFSYYSGKIVKDLSEDQITSDKVTFLKYLRFLDVLALKFLKRDFFVRFYYCFFPKTVQPYDPADIVIDDAIRILEKNKNKKLFLYVHFRDPHFPHVRPKGLRSYLLDSVEKRYNAEISFMDQEIGRLFDHVDKLGILNETLFIFTADHGESLREHGVYVAHHDPYENVVRIPLTLWGNNIPVKRIDAFVQNIDIFPTILEYLNIPISQKIDGKSFLPLIRNTSQTIREFVFFDDNLFGEYKIKKSRRKLGIRFKNYKYIKTHQGREEDLFQPIPVNTKVVKEELYDLFKDPEEENNLIQEQRSITVKLEKILQAQIDSLKKKK